MTIELKSKSKRRLKPEPTGSGIGIPVQRRLDLEAQSGVPLDDVRIHYNSERPAQLDALAYTQGNQIYLGPGQERHLGHELRHAIQQKQGRVPVTGHVAGLPLNDDPALEHEAEAVQIPWGKARTSSESAEPVQRVVTIVGVHPQRGQVEKTVNNLKDLFSQEIRQFCWNYGGHIVLPTWRDFFLNHKSAILGSIRPDAIDDRTVRICVTRELDSYIMQLSGANARQNVTDMYSFINRMKQMTFEGIHRKLADISNMITETSVSGAGRRAPHAPLGAAFQPNAGSVTSHSYSKPGGQIYDHYIKMIELNLIPSPPVLPTQLNLFHEDGSGDKQFLYELPDPPNPVGKLYCFLIGAHHRERGNSRSDLYDIKEGKGFFSDKVGKCIRLLNGFMYMGNYDVVKNNILEGQPGVLKL